MGGSRGVEQQRRGRGGKRMVPRVLLIFAGAILAVSVLYAGSRAAEAEDKVASRGSESPYVKGAAPVPPADHTDKGLQKGAGPKAITPAEHTDAAEWTGPSTQPPATTTGKLYVRFDFDHTPENPSDDKYKWCSASVVDSPAKDLVFTAGHCLLDTLQESDPWSDAVWAHIVVFIPAAVGTGSSPITVSAPYGRWEPRRIGVHDEWKKSGNNGYDVGAAAVVPTLNLPESNRLVEEVGANGIRFNEPAEQDAYVFGYPSIHANGERLYYCHDQSWWGGIFDPRMTQMICNFSDEASGGPWLMNFNGETGDLFSVTTRGGCLSVFCDSMGIKGPLFDESIRTFYNNFVGTDVPSLGRIAYQGWDGHDTEIYSMDSDGREQHSLTSNDQNDTYPTVSPDGARIAYSHVDGADAEIYTVNALGGTPVQVTHNNTDDSRPSYSGDGTRIAYERYDGNDWEIYTINATGGTRVQVTHNNRDDRDPDYAPSASGRETIAYRGWDGNDWEIYTIDAAGGTPVRLTHNNTNDLGPDYAPSASGRETIAYQGWDGNDYEIYEVNLRSPSEPPSRITYNDRGDGAPSYSPNGAHIVYMGDDGNDLEIYRINLTFGHLRQFTNNATEDANPSWGVPGKTKVPDVVGSYSSGAGQAIRNAGLVPKFTGASPGGNAWVYSQSPGAGTVVDRGSTVTCRLTNTGNPP